MDTQKTKDKGDKAKSTDFGFPPMGQRMFEVMSKCCTCEGEFPDCLVMMKSMMEATRNQPCCKPKKEATEFEERKK